MGTALNESAWSTTAASNDGADSTIGTVANTSSPTNVDDWVRGVMAARAKARLDQGGALVAGGTATELTVSTNQSLSSGHIANGLRLCVRTASAATGAATIAVDGLSAVSIIKNDGTAVASGEWASGSIIDLVYSSAASAFIATNIGSVTTRAGLGLATSDSPQFAGINVGDASDTTVTRASAGMIAVEGTTIEPGANRASFHAHKNGTTQTISSTTETQVTFGTESFDVGSKFASSAWTPPAGKVLLCFRGLVESVGSGNITLRIKRDTTTIAEHIAADTLAGHNVMLTIIDNASGSNVYRVYAQTSVDTSYTVYGPAVNTYFCGSML